MRVHNGPANRKTNSHAAMRVAACLLRVCSRAFKKRVKAQGIKAGAVVAYFKGNISAHVAYCNLNSLRGVRMEKRIFH